MASTTPTARDELLFRQVKGGRSLNLWLCVVHAAATLAAAGFAIGVIAQGRGLSPLIAVIMMGLGTTIPAAMYWGQYKKHSKALAEIGDDPAGMDTRKTFSRETALVIAGSRKTAYVLKQLWIAYGILAVTMLLFGMLLLMLMVFSSEVEVLFLIAGGVMWAGGLSLAALTIRNFREWRMAKHIEELE